MYLLGGYDGTDRLQDLYSIDVGALSPPSLLDICADYIRRNLDVVLERQSFVGVPSDLLHYVVFKRDGEDYLRGRCKICRPGRCGVYRLRHSEPKTESVRNKHDHGGNKHFLCECGHSNFHHELIDETRLYGRRQPESTSNKVLMLCGSIYKRLFESSTSPVLTFPRASRALEEARSRESYFA
ncbi:TPA: hypothetical protein N0F65_000138 [Lagenidium giganteum]|uniref:Uncharacterized protein n=1 Tax=Lagenidium giganteum TaxID=4803 RepID=A0AAV2YYB0_9STRA|nr:TPA: hypothetical protein N0F65_000138 [Lagenidium giganteum]